MKAGPRPWFLLMSLVTVACSSNGDTGGPTGPTETVTSRSTGPSGATVASPTPAQGPAARGYAMMADLPGEPGVVMLGGATVPGPPDLPDMWRFGPRSGWEEVTPPLLPELPSYGDGVIGNAFEFDGESDMGVFVDIEGNTWAYDAAANAWLEQATKGGPRELLGAMMVYDSRSDRMIVFGGLDLSTFAFNDQTWSYDLDANSWERMRPDRSPAPRNYYAMAYDESSDRTILFGGDDGARAFRDTWAYDLESETWTEMTPARSPQARTYSWMEYDPASDRVILFGGSTDMETAAFDDTWAYDYDRNRWTRLRVEGPSTRAWHAMAFDRESDSIVLFGGGTGREAYTAETWLFDPSTDTWSLLA